MKFGLNDRKSLTGTGLYVKVFQVVSILPLLYVFTATGYMGLFSKTGVLSVLFDLGISSLPRAEALFLSYLYRLTSSEVVIYFMLIAIALIAGIAFNKLSIKDEKTGINIRKAALVLISIDLILRIIPLEFNRTFGTVSLVFGFIIRLICLILIIMDLKSAKNTID